MINKLININSYIENKFKFLIEVYKFEQPLFYNNTGESYAVYIKKNIVICIGYRDIYWGSIFTMNNYKIIYRDETIKSIEYSKPRHYNLSKLDKNKVLYKSLLNINIRVRHVEYFYLLLINNSEILNGDFRKFTLWYNIKQKLNFLFPK
jgi:hypothetical protein